MIAPAVLEPNRMPLFAGWDRLYLLVGPHGRVVKAMPTCEADGAALRHHLRGVFGLPTMVYHDTAGNVLRFLPSPDRPYPIIIADNDDEAALKASTWGTDVH